MTIVPGRTVPLPDGRHVRAMEAGALDGTPVLVFHPSPASRLFVRVHAGAALRSGVRLVSFSRPGSGGSSAAAPGLRVVADDAAVVADAYGLERFAVLGVSGGTPFAAATAAVHGDRVSALGLCAALAPWRELDDPGLVADPAEEELLAVAEAGDSDAARVGLGKLAAQEYDELLAGDDEGIALAYRAMVPPPDDVLMTPELARALAVVVRDALEDDDERPAYDGLVFDTLATGLTWDVDVSTVTAPTWLWHGELDAVSPLSHARWYAERIRQATLVTLAGWGHLGALNADPDAVLATLRDA